MLTALIAISSIAQILVALFVFFRARNNLSYRLFFFIGMASLAWALANYLTVNQLDSPNLIYVVRFILFFVVLQNAAFCLFAHTFPGSTLNVSKRWLAGYASLTILAAFATVSPFVFTSVAVRDGLAITSAGPGILIFIAHAAFSIGTGFKNLVKKKRASSGILRRQFQLLLFASFLVWVIVPVTNFAITPLLKTTFFIVYAPVYTFAFAAIIAYAIVSQRLFDIRAAVARSVAYVLALGSFALIYGAVLFGIINTVFAGPDRELLRQIVSIITVVPFALSYQAAKGFFDRITNKIFYRDAYDGQVVLDEINRLLTQEISLNVITHDSLKILIRYLKISGGHFLVMDKGAIYRTATAGNPAEAVTFIHPENLGLIKRNMVISDNLSPGDTKEFLDLHHISIVLRLVTQKGTVGYILLGPKQSGDIYTDRDVRLLGIIADELAIGVQNARSFEEIRQFNITLQAKIEEATRELRRVNHRLRELDKTKDEFISMASHQLRTPLTAVKGYLSMVLDGDTGPVKKNQKEMVSKAYSGAQKMVYLIGDMLNVSRLQTGKFVIDNQPTNLAELVDGEVSQLQETASARNLKLIYHKPAKFPTLNLDETKVRQVVMNFIDNAIFYTPSGGSVTVDLGTSDESVQFTVSDTGIGIPASVQHHLFSKFYRADNARKMRPDGTGLGLFMAKKVITTQGGAIIFRSTEGKGSTFGFSFPRRALEVKNKPTPEKSPVQSSEPKKTARTA